MIRLTIPGPPCGKQRPRHTRNGHTYTPEKTVNYETLIREMFAAKYPRHTPGTGAVRMGLAIHMMPSKADARLMRKQAGVVPMKKPDIDNVLKIIADALNGLAYLDDKQIVEVFAVRLFSERPRVEIEIEALTPARAENKKQEVTPCHGKQS